MFEISLPFPRAFGACAIPGVMLFWSKEYLAKLTSEETRAVRLHEIGHGKNLGSLSIYVSLGNLLTVLHLFSLLKKFKVYRKSKFRKKLREASISWEALADAYALENGVTTKTIISALKKTGLGQALKIRFIAVKRAQQLFKKKH